MSDDTEILARNMRPLTVEEIRSGLRQDVALARRGTSEGVTARITAARAELTYRQDVRALCRQLGGETVFITDIGKARANEMLRHWYTDATHKILPESTARRLEMLCSLLCRLAPAYHRIQEMWCSVEMSDARRARWERAEARIERRARVIGDAFPPCANGQRVSIVFTGDPRGFTIRVKVPGAPQDGNTWGRDGEYGMGES